MPVVDLYIAFRFKEVQERCKSGSTEVSFFGQFLAKDSFRVRPLRRSRCLRAGPVNTALTGAKRNAEGRPRKMRPNGTFSSLARNLKFPQVSSLWLRCCHHGYAVRRYPGNDIPATQLTYQLYSGIQCLVGLQFKNMQGLLIS